MEIFYQILKKHWGLSTFRPLQEEIIRSVYEGNDTLALMPTGGGKSITFQVPALAKEGICLVITPLIALMKDQVENLKKRGIKAVAIHSGMTRHEIDIELDNCIYGDFKFIYLSPERLTTPLFRERLKKLKVNLIAIDESHCISQWGYDFRPSYMRIAELRGLIPDAPFLALTATATPEVANDIQEKLHFRQKNILKMSFERKNLVYLVRNVEDKNKHLIKIVTSIPGSGIVYVRNREKTREIALLLRKEGIAADFYHAGLSPEMRNTRQDEWKKGSTKVIVSTNAFGMGIDKPDVRFVIHMDLPDSPEAYFQEAGRAGRDLNLAYAILLYNESDKSKIEQRIEANFPENDEIRRVYQALGSFFQVAVGAGKGEVYDFNLMDFASTYKLNTVKAYNSLKFLEREGYIELTDELDNPSRLMFIVGREELYKFQVANAELDKFIKVILRAFTGIFSHYVNIDEVWLARVSGIPADQVIENLKKLSKFKIVNYIPKKKTPLIIYTEERLDDKNLFLSQENYKLRKERFLKRIEAMVNYASQQTKCRSQFLLDYFGEKDSYRCGHCDICTSRNELEMSKMEFDKILTLIKEKLDKGPTKLESLVDSIGLKPDKVLKVIHFLLDNNKIVKSRENLLTWWSKAD